MLATMKLPLPAAAVLELERRAATREEPFSPDELRALLAEHGYVAHPAVLEFEVAFGGLEFLEEENGDDEMRFLVGAGACLASGAHVRPTGGDGQEALALVPVIYTPNDGIGFLDAQGAGWFQDTIEDLDARRVADDGAALLAGFLVAPE